MWKFKCAIPLLGYFKLTKTRGLRKTIDTLAPSKFYFCLLFLINLNNTLKGVL